MAWSERQQAMLREMGLRVWSPPPLVASVTETATPAAAAPPAAGAPVEGLCVMRLLLMSRPTCKERGAPDDSL